MPHVLSNSRPTRVILRLFWLSTCFEAHQVHWLVTDFSWVFPTHSYFLNLFFCLFFRSKTSTDTHGPWGDAHEWLEGPHVASGILIWSYPPHSRCNSSNSAIIRSFVSFWFPFQKNNLHYRGVFLLGSTVLCVLVNNWQFHLRPRKLIWHWKIPIFNRKYIFTHGGFSSQSCSFSVSGTLSLPQKLGGGFKLFFIFTPIWGNDPIWLICVKWVGSTTPQMCSQMRVHIHPERYTHTYKYKLYNHVL